MALGNSFKVDGYTLQAALGVVIPLAVLDCSILGIDVKWNSIIFMLVILQIKM